MSGVRLVSQSKSNSLCALKRILDRWTYWFQYALIWKTASLSQANAVLSRDQKNCYSCGCRTSTELERKIRSWRSELITFDKYLLKPLMILPQLAMVLVAWASITWQNRSQLWNLLSATWNAHLQLCYWFYDSVGNSLDLGLRGCDTPTSSEMQNF